MQLKSFILIIAIVGLVVGSRVSAITPPVPSSPDDNLLLRVRFAGTAALIAKTNDASLANLIALPESLALAAHIVERTASLPPRFIGIADTNGLGKSVQPMFAEIFRQGFTLELRGSGGIVTEFAFSTEANEVTVKRWENALHTTATNLSAKARLVVNHSQNRVFVAGSKTDPSAALTAIQTAPKTDLEAGTLIQGELNSSLTPPSIQRSIFGGFKRLKFTVSASDQSLNLCGVAEYPQNLPKLDLPVLLPTNFITAPPISFTLVREPYAWLDPSSPLKRFLPHSTPGAVFFWGGDSSPYQFFTAIPFSGKEDFNNNFGPALLNQLLPLAEFMNTGPVVLDTNRAGIQWQGVPFLSPQALIRTSGTNSYLVAETFPGSETSSGLTPALIERVSNRTNLVVYDWEFTQLRIDTWIRLGQLALLVSNNKQLEAEAPSLKWLLAAQKNLSNGGNTSTEITQTGPRELTLKRSGPLALSSIEIFWLANWLESQNFPAANFLVPAEQ